MSDSDGEEDDQPPIMHHRLISHPGSVNRIRAMPQQPSLVATWSERGTVQARNTCLSTLTCQSVKAVLGCIHVAMHDCRFTMVNELPSLRCMM